MIDSAPQWVRSPASTSTPSQKNPISAGEDTGLGQWHVYPQQAPQPGSHRDYIYSVPKLHALTIKPYCHPFLLLGLASRNHKGATKLGKGKPHCVTSFPIQAHSCLGSFPSQVPWIYTSILGWWSQAPSTGRSQSASHLLPGSQACLGCVFSFC